MRSESERGEREGDSENPFEKYAEELGEKYVERVESGEESQDITKPIPAAKGEVTGDPEEMEDSGKGIGNLEDSIGGEAELKETGEINADEFETYTKELKEKYDGEDGGVVSTQVRGGTPGTDDEYVSQDDRPREFGQGEQDSESAKSGVRQREDTSEEAPLKSTEVGGYQRIVDDSSDRMDVKTIPLSSEQAKDTSPDETVDQKEQEPQKAVDSRQDGPPRALSVDGVEPGKKRLDDEDAVPKEVVYGVEKPNDRTGDSDEKHVATIVGGRTHKLANISDDCLESTGLRFNEVKGDKDLVLEIHGRIAGEQTIKHFFGTYRLDTEGNFRLWLGNDDAKLGDQFEVLKTVPHDVDSFLGEFEKGGPKSLENVAFNRGARGLMMNVDGAEYQLRNPNLRTFAGKAELSGCLAASDRLIQLRIGGERATARIESCVITEMKVSNGVLDITYQQSEHAKKSHHFRLARDAEGKAFAVSAYETGGAIGFGIPKRAFREATGKVMKAGKEYTIEGRIQGIGHFKVNHFESEKTTRSSKVNLILGQEANGKLKPRERYSVVIESIHERRDFRVIGKRNDVKISRSSIGSLGLDARSRDKNEIREIRVRNLSRPNAPVTRYFVILRPEGYKAPLRIEMSESRRGETVRLSPRRYVMRQFVNDFNSYKPESLKNVNLSFNKTHVTMAVDGKNVILREPRLEAFSSQAKMTANIEATGRRIIFYFDGTKINARLFRFYGIQSVKASDSGLEISYSKAENETRTFLMRFNRFDRSTLVGNVTMVSSPHTGNESYHFRVTPRLQRYVESKLIQFREDLGKYGHRTQKGNISEEIQHHLLSLIPGWEKIAEHPFNTAPNADPARKSGPDALYRRRKSGGLHLVEFKWDLGHDGYSSGSKQMRGYLSKYPEYKGEKIVQGYIGILSWDTRSRDMFLYLRKAASARDSSIGE